MAAIDMKRMSWEDGVTLIIESYKRSRKGKKVEERNKPYWWNEEIES